ncbi:MAG TPA: hypothetical protein VME24_06090 [Alphaproteobacteria bacterium]|nr:hypothetical protein [Alphaproteobacteria bacterium]
MGIAIWGNDLFVANNVGNTVGEYTTAGATVNASLISGLNLPTGIAISGNGLLFVANSGDGGTIGEYTLSGAAVNTNLISGLDYPYGIAISGTNLFVANYYGGTVGEYTTSGAKINASLIGGLGNLDGIATPVLVPQLNIATVDNQSVLFYPYSVLGANYVLQCVTNLASTNWLTVSNGVPVIGVTVPNNLPASFFRLEPAE